MAGDLIALAVAIGRVARGLAITPMRAEALVTQWTASGELYHAQLDPIYTQGRRAVPKGGKIGSYDPGADLPDCVVWVDPDDLERLIDSHRSNTVKPAPKRTTHPPRRQRILDDVLRGLFPPHGVWSDELAILRVEQQVACKWNDACQAQGERPGNPPRWQAIKSARSRLLKEAANSRS
jgi:hypothetical protein